MVKTLDYDAKKQEIVISFDYDSNLVDKCRSLTSRYYDNKAWHTPVQYYKEVKQKLDGHGFICTQALLDKIAELKADEQAKQLESDVWQQRFSTYQVLVLPNGRNLFKHQIIGYKFLLDNRFAILADDMGLGKSLQALVAAKAFDLPVYVICPASLLINWKREAAFVGVDITPVSWAKIPKSITGSYVLIADEAHYAQNLKSQRTAAFLHLANSDNCKGLFLLSGTPIKNGRPVNLFPLLKAIKHPLASNKSNYERRYCDGHLERIGKRKIWVNDGASNLPELHEKIKGVMLRRTKKECLDLPDKTRIQRGIEASTESKKLYDDKFNELRQRYLDKVTAKVENVAEHKREAKKQELISKSEALVMLGAIRQASSSAKVESAVEIAQEVIEQGGQVVLFTNYVEVGETIASQLKCLVLSGSVVTKNRQSMIDGFQSGVYKALVCTYGAGGVGITLTAAQTVILVDRPFTPGETDQAEDRLHRIGQQNAVTAIWLAYGNTDYLIDAMINNKQENIDIILNGKKQTLSRTDDTGQMAQDILNAVFNAELSDDDKALMSDLSKIKVMDIE